MTSINEPFTLIEENRKDGDGPYRMFQDVREFNSAKSADHDLSYMQLLRDAFPEYIVTGIPTGNVPLLRFADAGFARYDVDKDTDSFASWRGYSGPSPGIRQGRLAETVHFAKYFYTWNDEVFVVYVVRNVQYVLKERVGGEHPLGPSRITDELIQAVGGWLLNEVVWVFDNYWYQDKKLYQQVQKMTWDKVILDEHMKEELTTAADKFFTSKAVYDDLGVPWKRGLMFHGPPGNGKTISIKALMHTLLDRRHPIPTLYVKSAPQVFHINAVFTQARALAPCMLVLEDIETIVRPETRSYFFNQMDGLEDNSGLFVVASTNFLDRLDPGLTQRPSRFDRKYLFPIPNEHERLLYCRYWRGKVRDVPFPEKLCAPMARITSRFSFAFLQECFVAALLEIAHQTADRRREGGGGGDDEGLEKYQLWRAFRKQADVLRKEIDPGEAVAGGSAVGGEWAVAAGLAFGSDGQHAWYDGEAAAPTAAHDETLPRLDSQFVVANRLVGLGEGTGVEAEQKVAQLGYGKSTRVNPKVFELV